MDNGIHWFEPVYEQSTSPQQFIETGHGILAMETPLHHRIMSLKNEIDTITERPYTTIQLWDDAKKITNPYEYIFLSLQKRQHKSIAAIAPLSRSYFKMIEMWDLLKSSMTLPAHEPLRTAHSAEGPGGFLEAIQHRQPGARMIAMTLRSTERTIPGWRKSAAFLSRYPEVLITYGADSTGNLYSLDNQAAFERSATYHLGDKADLYTADGGFDFSADFNAQENTVQRLLVAEALCGLKTLKVGGTMILKLFDTKNAATLDILWTLSTCFDRTGMIKPHTSRPANSERYWIGSGLRATIPAWVPELLSRLTSSDDATPGWNQIYINPSYPASWFHQLYTFQCEVEEFQIISIQRTLHIINEPVKAEITRFLLENIHKSREWCTRHSIPVNRTYHGLTDDQVVSLNLEEALAPFPTLVARTNLPALFRPLPMHRVSTVAPPPRLPVVAAWSRALPESVRDPAPYRTIADILRPWLLTAPVCPPVRAPGQPPPGLPLPSAAPIAIAALPE
jgi:hypothetical protein